MKEVEGKESIKGIQESSWKKVGKGIRLNICVCVMNLKCFAALNKEEKRVFAVCKSPIYKAAVTVPNGKLSFFPL